MTGSTNIRDVGPSGWSEGNRDPLTEAKGVLLRGCEDLGYVPSSDEAKLRLVDVEGTSFVHHWTVPRGAIPQLRRRGRIDA